MILSVSRRTDIPAYYSAWFLNRLAEGFVLVPNPHNPRQLSRIPLSPETVDCIVFWTKNPTPMLDALPRIEAAGYPFYFQFTLTPYGPRTEPGLPPKEELVRAFWALSRRLGPKRVVWRYDPVMVDGRYPTAWHLERFEALCNALEGAAERCVFSFVDPYRHTGGAYRETTRSECLDVAGGFGEIAARHGFSLFTCAETIDLSAFGIGHAACIDPELVGGILGCPVKAAKDPGQRPACGCCESVDIGAYNTCPGGCAYCYATTGRAAALRCAAAHDPAAPMLTGWPRGGERISDRAAKSLKTAQTTLY
ncbi:DUF1848 domain-containing protein [Anaerotruncus massiliensis (ex Togo et al. 2019)]|uniref:DUF1848 domain-containing protein n=1 Tax=Anaerotruncus TaxID=244127 RepID=UPI002082A061|nr:DUF1848 domain-containing protein [Anaerotruncus massiliensis (ex Togo et al. 2019)]GKH45678.1 hypothetical protein CE91St45_02400 [Oscillospiraceae bacterium]